MDSPRPLMFVWMLIGSACSRSIAPIQNGDEAEVVSTVHAYDDAWHRKDTTTVGRLLAAGYVYFTSRGAVWDRPRSLALLGSPRYVLEFAERSEVAVHLHGSTTAVLATRWRGRGTYEGEAFVDDQRCSLVLDETEGRWQILAEHCTQITAP